MATEQPAPRAIWNIINSRFPQTRFLGILMPPGHEDHSEGRALDVGLWAWVPAEKRLAYRLIDILRDYSFEVGWSYLIWNKQIWYSDDRGGPLPYERAAEMPHTEHIHISWSEAASKKSTFNAFRHGMDELLKEEHGGVEDEHARASFMRPYSSK